MSRIATLTAVICILVATSAFASGHRDLRSPQRHLPSSHANVHLPAQDPAAKPSQSGVGSDVNWAIFGVVVAALAATGTLVVKTRRATGPPARV